MAEKNVVRQDVVQISWKVDNSKLKTLMDMLKQLRRNISGLDVRAQGTWSKMVQGANKVKNTLGPLNDKINALGKSVANVGKKFAVKFGQLAKKAILSVAGAITTITTLSVKAFADYEQLKGGVETLFGAQGMSLEQYAKSVGKSTDAVKDKYNSLLKSQELVFKDADKAYMTAGLSANDYMETVTGFSASLLQSLGGDTVKAAQVSNKAIIDMADNANKMGTPMENIRNAYQGFAKQNYMMLDNLKLGKDHQIAQYKPRENGETLALCA